MNADEAIKTVNSWANGRTRYEGQRPFIDEVLVTEIERLRAECGEYETTLHAAEDRVKKLQEQLASGLNMLNKLKRQSEE